MLKGHVFTEQRFGSQIFALFVNTFLNGKNGIHNDYKESMEVTYSGSTLTIHSGAACIQGRFLEEDTSTDISAGTDTMYCKLVIEIDLDKQNTETVFLQGAYKVIKSASAYPTLTQQNIIKNNAGVYQYELARFRTGVNGILDFQDTRTYIDFNSIYEKIENEIHNIEEGSIYALKEDFEKEIAKIQYSRKVVLTYKNSGQLAAKITDIPDIYDNNYIVCVTMSATGETFARREVVWKVNQLIYEILEGNILKISALGDDFENEYVLEVSVLVYKVE